MGDVRLQRGVLSPSRGHSSGFRGSSAWLAGWFGPRGTRLLAHASLSAPAREGVRVGRGVARGEFR